jgi:hypothetical protein
MSIRTLFVTLALIFGLFPKTLNAEDKCTPRQVWNACEKLGGQVRVYSRIVNGAQIEVYVCACSNSAGGNLFIPMPQNINEIENVFICTSYSDMLQYMCFGAPK